jgi:hypothetical protein
MSMQATRIIRIRPVFATSPRRAACALAAVAAILALAATPALAAMYKWVDANGRVIYSDQPPTNGNYKVESISAPPPPANPNAVRELASKEAELQQKKVTKADEEAKAAKARVDANMKRDQCARARGQILAMQSDQNQNVVMYRANEKGEQVYMDDAARRTAREQTEVWVRENCTS